MPKSFKTPALILGALVGLIVLIAIALSLFWDLNAHKPRLEAAASEIAGMDVRIDGRIGIAFFPGVAITLEDVHVRNRGTEIVTTRKARIGVDFLALLRQDIRLRHATLEQPVIYIERDRAGRYNYERPESVRQSLPDLSLAKLVFADGVLRYLDRRSGWQAEAAACDLDARDLQIVGRQTPGILKQLSVAADIACKTVRTNDYAAADLNTKVDGQNGIFDLEPLTMRLFDGQGAGRLRANFTQTLPRYDLSYTLTQFRLDALLKTLSPQSVPQGAVDLTAQMAMQGRSVKNLKQTLAGEVTMRGTDLVFNGRDLDEAFDNFESSQSFNLMDVGAVFLAGPLGLAVTKGYNFASILQGSEGRSEIRTLVSDWTVERGIARSQDVAIATRRHRVALQGRLDFVDARLDGVTVALVDAKGCIRAQQSIHGPFSKPVVEKVSTLKALTGPVVSLFKQVGALFPGGACEVFYAGSVAAPK
ncbi:MAG: AsmA family protein [Thiobacillus sp.]|nr:AsmA family protein [Thiobacillus sp.]